MALSQGSGRSSSVEQAIGDFVLGFVGDPERIADEDKWRLYEALVEAGALVGEVVLETWDAALTDAAAWSPEGGRRGRSVEGHPPP